MPTNSNKPINNFCLKCFKVQYSLVRVCDRGTYYEEKIGHYLCDKHKS